MLFPNEVHISEKKIKITSPNAAADFTIFQIISPGSLLLVLPVESNFSLIQWLCSMDGSKCIVTLTIHILVLVFLDFH